MINSKYENQELTRTDKALWAQLEEYGLQINYMQKIICENEHPSLHNQLIVEKSIFLISIFKYL